MIWIVLLIVVGSLGMSLVVRKSVEKTNDRYDVSGVDSVWMLWASLFCVYLLVWIEGTSWSEWLMYGSVLTLVFGMVWIDYRNFVIPDRWNIALMLVGIPWMVLTLHWGTWISIGVLFLLFIGLHAFYKGGLGGGDMKLYFALTVILGYQGLVVFFMSMIVAMGYIIVKSLWTRKMVKKLPFAPHIFMGLVITWLWGDEIVKGYLSIIGL